jgi:hypothetical protein
LPTLEEWKKWRQWTGNFSFELPGF